MKKIKALTISAIMIANITVASTNKEIIENGRRIHKETFDKHYRKETKSKKDSNLLNQVYSEIITDMFSINKKIYDEEYRNSKGKRKKSFQNFYTSYIGFIVENSNFSKVFLGNFLEERDDYQAYVFTNTSILLETFNLNMNTILDGEKNKETIEDNINAVVDYMYFTGDDVRKEDYLKMTNAELEKYVNSAYSSLMQKIEAKAAGGNEGMRKAVNSAKSSLAKLEKEYVKQSRNFAEYVENTNLRTEDKENIKKLMKFEYLVNLKFFIQSMEEKKEM